MQLYTHPYSSNARRVKLVAHHLGLTLDMIDIDLGSPADRARLAAVNPNGKVPVLVDDDFVLSESCAIIQYLADCTPGQTVYPTDTMARADVNRWLFWSAQHFAPAISIFTWENVWKKRVTGQDADPAELARGAQELEETARVLDAHLAGREWICGDQLTLADFAVAAPVMYRQMASLPLDGYPNLLAWFERVQQLPAWQATNPV